MFFRYKLLLVTLTVAATLAQANPIDDVESKKESRSSKSSLTTIAPAALVHEPVSDPTKKPEGGAHKFSLNTVHPSVTIESVKGTTGDQHVSVSNQFGVTEAPKVDQGKAMKNGQVNPLHKFCEYVDPICNTTDKLAPKMMGKIQTHFKRIIQASSGKLSYCFLEHFGFDPNLDPVTKANLVTLCKSKDLAPDLKGSFKSFEPCALQNWDATVDSELDKILAARANCTKNHNHAAKNETLPVADLHEEGEDELSLISAVVNQVYEDNKGQFANSSDVKFIDVNMPTTSKPAASGNSSESKSIKEGNNGTVILPLDESKSTPAPLINKTNSTLKSGASLEEGDVLQNKTIELTSSKKIEEKTSLGDKMRPASNITESKKLSISTGVLPGASTVQKETSIKPTLLPAAKVFENPLPKVELSVTNKPVLDVKLKLTTIKPLITTSPKPVIQTLEEVLKRQEKEKQALENRLREEREVILKQLQKRQDEIDAQNAIKALQMQRDATTNQHSDARLHQLEHERQMAIDPIGHTIKHQQYEFNKQQRAMING